MKKLFAVMLCTSSVVYAESQTLPPVIDHSIYQNGSYRATTSSSSAMYEVLGRLEQLQLEVQQLRGIVEEQSNTIAELKNRQNNIYSDLDQRLQELSGNESMSGKVFATGQQPGMSSITTTAIVNNTPPSTDQTTTLLDNTTTTEKSRYQEAYETLRNGHNTRAIVAFKSLLVDFPNGEYADNAQYWLGEAYKVNQDVNSAKQAFNRVVADYPTSPKVPDALLKLGYIEFEQKNITQAKDYFKRITVNYPDTTAAHLATKKLQSLGVM